ncbi:TetR/AcrR family transcriptional regulator [Amycolatopsis sp. NPDC059021]|uniref:TetR/AcrR family transcriptional regulator n=1 Tax=Amycolatopsis sp. NPDC059021 TaxID=3346704 RepID=UPI00366E0F38
MPGRRGVADPQRRERMITAAERVVIGAGLAGLSHRAVAEEAGVPLGSTTYYFATLSELRQAALRRLLENYRAWLHEWAERIGRPPPAKLVGHLTDMVCEGIAEHRQHIVAEFELSVAALRDPEVAEVATGYSAVTTEVLSAMAGKRAALALTAAFNGVHLEALTRPGGLSRRQIASVFRAILLP